MRRDETNANSQILLARLHGSGLFAGSIFKRNSPIWEPHSTLTFRKCFNVVGVSHSLQAGYPLRRPRSRTYTHHVYCFRTWVCHRSDKFFSSSWPTRRCLSSNDFLLVPQSQIEVLQAVCRLKVHSAQEWASQAAEEPCQQKGRLAQLPLGPEPQALRLASLWRHYGIQRHRLSR